MIYIHIYVHCVRCASCKGWHRSIWLFIGHDIHTFMYYIYISLEQMSNVRLSYRPERELSGLQFCDMQGRSSTAKISQLGRKLFHKFCKVFRFCIHLGRLTWNLQITHLERKVIFQTSMIMFHVNLQGCISNGKIHYIYTYILIFCTSNFLWEKPLIKSPRVPTFPGASECGARWDPGGDSRHVGPCSWGVHLHWDIPPGSLT